MNSIVDVGDSSQSPRGPRTPWSPVRVNRPHRGLSPVAPPNSDPSSFHAVLADTDCRVDVTITLPYLRNGGERILLLIIMSYALSIGIDLERSFSSLSQYIIHVFYGAQREFG